MNNDDNFGLEDKETKKKEMIPQPQICFFHKIKS